MRGVKELVRFFSSSSSSFSAPQALTLFFFALSLTATHLLRLSLTAMLSLPSSYLSTLPTPHPSRWLQGPDELVLETEDDNFQALGFYKKMGFVREKGLYKFYLNGKGAGRLRLDLTERGTGVVGGGKGEREEEEEVEGK